MFQASFQDDISAIAEAVPLTRRLCFGTPDGIADEHRQKPPNATPTSYSASRQRVSSFHFCNESASVQKQTFLLDEVINAFVYETPKRTQPTARHVVDSAAKTRVEAPRHVVDSDAKTRVEAILRDYPVIWKRPRYFFRQFIMRKANVSDEQLDTILHIRADTIRAK